MMTKEVFAVLTAALIGGLTVSCEQSGAEPDGGAPEKREAKKEDVKKEDEQLEAAPATAPEGMELATFGGGCFWCVEAVMERLEGVSDVTSGYMGGHVDHPTYEQVCKKDTGHAEVVQVTFDPKVIKYEELLDIFWQAHDPTTKDRQGNDVGPQYRSVIFYHSEAQKEAAEKSMRELNVSGKYSAPAVTEIEKAATLWEAEDYHQDFYENNKNYPYCRVIIHPKLKKLGME